MRTKTCCNGRTLQLALMSLTGELVLLILKSCCTIFFAIAFEGSLRLKGLPIHVF